MEDAPIGVLFPHAHAFRERVADDGHAHHARPMRPDLGRSELLGAVPALDGEGRMPRGVVETGEAEGPVLLQRRGVA